MKLIVVLDSGVVYAINYETGTWQRAAFGPVIVLDHRTGEPQEVGTHGTIISTPAQVVPGARLVLKDDEGLLVRTDVVRMALVVAGAKARWPVAVMAERLN